jgi:hypothetical protein
MTLPVKSFLFLYVIWSGCRAHLYYGACCDPLCKDLLAIVFKRSLVFLRGCRASRLIIHL